MDGKQKERRGDALGTGKDRIDDGLEQRERSGDGLGTESCGDESAGYSWQDRRIINIPELLTPSSGLQAEVGTQSFFEGESGLLWRDSTLSTIVSSEFSRPISL
jgi:hypothetical protein